MPVPYFLSYSVQFFLFLSWFQLYRRVPPKGWDSRTWFSTGCSQTLELRRSVTVGTVAMYAFDSVRQAEGLMREVFEQIELPGKLQDGFS